MQPKEGYEQIDALLNERKVQEASHLGSVMALSRSSHCSRITSVPLLPQESAYIRDFALCTSAPQLLSASAPCSGKELGSNGVITSSNGVITDINPYCSLFIQRLSSTQHLGSQGHIKIILARKQAQHNTHFQKYRTRHRSYQMKGRNPTVLLTTCQQISPAVIMWISKVSNDTIYKTLNLNLCLTPLKEKINIIMRRVVC